MAQAKQRPPSGKRKPSQPSQPTQPTPPPAPKGQPTESAQKLAATERRAQRAAEAKAQQKRRQTRFLVIGLVVAAILAVAAALYIREQLVLQTIGVTVPDEGAGHVNDGTPLTFVHSPPSSGKHYPSAQPAGIYATQEVNEGYWVHSLEHGYVVALVNCDTNCDAIFSQLKDLYDSGLKKSHFGNVKFVATKYSKPFTDGNSPPVTLVAWDHEMELGFDNGQLDRKAIQRFYDKFVDKGPEDIP
jgi:Protein of unknown function (DUF3105)